MVTVIRKTVLNWDLQCVKDPESVLSITGSSVLRKSVYVKESYATVLYRLQCAATPL